ncbi:hypothetical protein P171DRAFT_507876 [Karstenula rhodostoma CBS 690.94]|uniref:Ankyrin n=1 Tax=Karstenula rhodostoma CBS 690.94 TaxID=1392251 RepID=A0A9P4UGW6_9PLEO|nr:hypothetical protein P171DRAFT_507876 [Karstenula rhodostoma CBS 690.94]
MRYVDSAFRGHFSDNLPHTARDMINDIGMRHNGIFLWAILVFDQVIEDIDQGYPTEEVLLRLRKLPERLTALYREILQRLRGKHAAQSLKLLQWACFWETPGKGPNEISESFHIASTFSSVRPRFSIGNLRTFMNFEPHLNTLPCGSRDNADSIFILNDEMMEYKVKILSGGLVCLDKHDDYDDKGGGGGGIALVHASVEDFLLKEGFRILDNWDTSPAENTMGEGSRDAVVYALNHAFAHASIAKKGGAEFPRTFISHLQPVLRKETIWVDLLQSELPGILENLYHGPATWSSEDASIGLGTSVLSVLSTLYNLPIVLDHIESDRQQTVLSEATLDRSEATAHGRMPQKILYLAANAGYIGVVDVLLRQGVYAQRTNTTLDFHLGCPVLAAGTNNHFTIVRKLNAHGFSVHKESLQYLIRGKAEWKMCDLFIELGADPSASGSPLIAAVETGKLDIVRLLLHHGANPNAKGRPIGSPLSSLLSPLEVAINGTCDYDIVKTLLEGGANVGPIQPDGKSHIEHYQEGNNDKKIELSSV